MGKNLLYTGTGCYLSLHDAQMYEKILRYDLKDEKFLYSAALILEKRAERHFSEFRETRKKASYRRYKKGLGEARSSMRKSWRNGCIYAGKDVLRLDNRLGRPIPARPRLFDETIDFLTLLLLCFMAGALLPVIAYLLR
jgi:hypothetical protein